MGFPLCLPVLRLYTPDSAFTHRLIATDMSVRELAAFHKKDFHPQ